MPKVLASIKASWDFLKVRKRWWLLPAVLVFVIIGLLMLFSRSDTEVPFYYALF